ncbi:MAG: TolC family protein [Gemmataceae bacterium]|nr:TolC family protein [Gemmataceae bacterium]
MRSPSFGTELTPEAVIAQVMARNPTLAQMTAAVHLAASRYPQVTSLDDPTFSSWVAPASLGSNKVNDSARFELSQKFPFPGKRELKGEQAQAQTAAAGFELEDARLKLVESVRGAYADYYLAVRATEVNEEGLRLLNEFRRNAETRYQTGQVPQQDVLQADVEVGRQRESRLGLERARTVAVARLNTLMSLPPESPLPPPAKELKDPSPLPSVPELRATALSRRPDLEALKARLAADQAALALAQREYYPDLEAMAAYDSFWQAADDQQRLRPQVGLRLNLPFRTGRRDGAVSEASAQLVQRRAVLAQQENEVAFAVQEAHAQVRESEQAIKLYADTILPAARENVKSAQAAYVTGKVPFLSLVEAQRSLVNLRDRAYLAAADYERRLSTLERVVGGPVQGRPSGPPQPLPTLRPAKSAQ